MRSKLLDLAHWGNKQGESNGNGNANSNATPEPGKRAPEVAAVAKKIPMELAGENSENLAGELLSMENIYRAAGIVGPRKGYSIIKVAEMLHSEHIRGLSKEMKRSSVLMALDAAGIPIDEVVRDAKIRQEAIDGYQVEQRKQFQAQPGWCGTRENYVWQLADDEATRSTK